MFFMTLVMIEKKNVLWSLFKTRRFDISLLPYFQDDDFDVNLANGKITCNFPNPIVLDLDSTVKYPFQIKFSLRNAKANGYVIVSSYLKRWNWEKKAYTVTEYRMLCFVLLVYS
jgi:hypothetical protein